ncbi:8-oxo-dGTP diphosphatase [Murinocardiopsis flavida]|uniref:8-oxo-dGTP diphosphatase n=1 Tax=Murinocardiopsis flavida TaxID=645275 RepID=A0A2P8DJA8_9ACTN|nr:(deoxy)nucleoside triphosphate pyrophosphohydrolase [Murinocardiopsis flavida]PSK97313.1 8-oxo-dGTP diphosphatase [Murinocardiopsis flavida]
MTDTVIVVAGAIVRDGSLLAAQRAEPAQMRGRWELPGGKVDPGETDEAALVRECREELGADVRPLARIGTEAPFPQRVGAPPAVLRVWLCEVLDGEPAALEHLALRWLGPEAIDGLDWLPADRPFLGEIRRHLNGG